LRAGIEKPNQPVCTGLVEITDIDKIGQNRYKIKSLKFSLKNQKPIGFVKNRMISLIYQMIFLKPTVFLKKN
jgi:hypothetical protein